MEMSELLTRVIRRRRLQIHGQCQEKKERETAGMHMNVYRFVHNNYGGLSFYTHLHFCKSASLLILPNMYCTSSLTVYIIVIILPTDYELEKKDYPDELVDLSSTLASQGTMDFVLVRNISKCMYILMCIM